MVCIHSRPAPHALDRGLNAALPSDAQSCGWRFCDMSLPCLLSSSACNEAAPSQPVHMIQWLAAHRGPGLARTRPGLTPLCARFGFDLLCLYGAKYSIWHDSGSGTPVPGPSLPCCGDELCCASTRSSRASVQCTARSPTIAA